MNRQEAARIVVDALDILGCPGAKPQLPNRRLSQSEMLQAMPRPTALHKQINVALWQPEAIKRFREAMEVYEAIEDSRMRVQ